MAILKALSASTYTELLRLVNGIISSKANLVVGRDISPNPEAAPNNLYKHPLAGKTLVFSVPASTVTFSEDVDYKEVVSEINAHVGSVVAHLVNGGSNGQLQLALWNDSSPVTLADTGTANSYFGFSVTPGDPDLVQTPIAPANIISIGVEVLSRKWVCFYHS